MPKKKGAAPRKVVPKRPPKKVASAKPRPMRPCCSS